MTTAMTVPSTMTRVRPVMVYEDGRAIDSLTRAFEEDPCVRWMYPDFDDHCAFFADFVEALAGKAFERGTAHCTDDLSGVALWLPPGVTADDDALVGVIMRTVPADRQDDLFTAFEMMAEYHPPQPHWYLPLLGVDPFRRNRGLGSSLMAYALETCDRQGLPAYLESSNPRNITLYERHGFVPLGEVRAGEMPPLVPMIRGAR